jgi:hypothetical protein
VAQLSGYWDARMGNGNRGERNEFRSTIVV